MSLSNIISLALYRDVDAVAAALRGVARQRESGHSLLVSRRGSPSAPAGGASSPLCSAHIHLGTFDGERRRRSTGYREDYGAAKALASLAAMTAFLFVAGLIAGAV